MECTDSVLFDFRKTKADFNGWENSRVCACTHTHTHTKVLARTHTAQLLSWEFSPSGLPGLQADGCSEPGGEQCPVSQACILSLPQTLPSPVTTPCSASAPVRQLSHIMCKGGS